MNVRKKLIVLALALVTVLALSVSASATSNPAALDGGVAGAYETANTPVIDDNRSVNIVKELIADNANSTSVNAPVFSYTYTVAAATVVDDSDNQYTVTDAANKHNPQVAVEIPVTAGVVAGLTVTGTSAGTTGSASAPATGTLAFTNSTQLTTTADTTTEGVNSYPITLNFSGVSFPKAGVYRYEITESLANSATYSGLGMVAGNSNTTKVRYLDVYVDGDREIYGYVCMATNGNVTTTTSKTNGFVSTSSGADTYYTYDISLTKDVENDTYAETNHAFPFTVIFAPGSLSGTFAITETVGTGSTGINPATPGNAGWSGVAYVKEGGAITYTGIPVGASVTIYETNDFTGATYTAATALSGGATATVTDDSVTSGDAPQSASEQNSRAAYESTAYTLSTTIGTAVTALVGWKITNTLLQISPTGVTLRYAPYLLTLGAGIVALPMTRSYKKREEF